LIKITVDNCIKSLSGICGLELATNTGDGWATITEAGEK